MSKVPSMLVVTTNSDISVPLFLEKTAQQLIESVIVKYDDKQKVLDKLFQHDFHYLYFRDPFNDPGLSQDKARNITQWVLEKYKRVYRVDGISSYEDMLFEDKWNQYKLFYNLMPTTKLLSSLDVIDFKTQFVKKRISSRSKGVIFEGDAFPNNAQANDYLVQNKIDIEQEYRVYMVGGKVMTPIATKSHKTPHQKVKITGLESKVKPEITRICKEVYVKTRYDFAGLDIAETKNNYTLLEVNRSCQFKSYYKFSSLNLATALNLHLLKH